MYNRRRRTDSNEWWTTVQRKWRLWPPQIMTEAASSASRARLKTWSSVSRLCPLVLLAFALLPNHANAQDRDATAGTLYFKSDAGRVEAPRMHTDVDMKVSGIVARVEVRQRFANQSDRWVEGIYTFPLPENSAVDRMHMRVGERVIVGEIREKAEAQQLYQQARANGQRASVVHQQRPNIFRTAVANIGPHETVDITIAYLQIVDQQAGRYSLRFPLTITPRYIPGVSPSEAPLTSETPVLAMSPAAHDRQDVATLGDLQPAFAHPDTARQSVNFDISLDAGVSIDNVKSAYHAIQMASVGGNYRIRLASKTIAPDRDFELAWTPIVHGGPATALFRERTESGEHVLLMFMPPQEHSVVSTPREVIFIIDTSGSMSGDSIEQARAALLTGLATLTPRDRFNLIQFNSFHSALFGEPVVASTTNLDTARGYVRSLEANGGTEMLPALSAAMQMPRSSEHLRQIMFITDGAVSNETELMRAITEGLGDARLFTVGIGSAPNGYFMRTAAEAGRGTFTFIGSIDQVEQRMNELFRKLTHPVLTGIELQWPNDVVPEYAPAQVRDLYADEPIVVSARLQGKLEGVLTITGRAGDVWTRQISLSAEPRAGVATPGIAMLWARNRVADLMNLQARRVSDNDIRAQVLPLALEYQLVTKYTSLVAVDKTPVRRPGESLDTTRIESTKPHGQNWEASGIPKTATPAQLQLLIGMLAMLSALAFHLLSRRRIEANS